MATTAARAVSSRPWRSTGQSGEALPALSFGIRSPTLPAQLSEGWSWSRSRRVAHFEQNAPRGAPCAASASWDIRGVREPLHELRQHVGARCGRTLRPGLREIQDSSSGSCCGRHRSGPPKPTIPAAGGCRSYGLAPLGGSSVCCGRGRTPRRGTCSSAERRPRRKATRPGQPGQEERRQIGAIDLTLHGGPAIQAPGSAMVDPREDPIPLGR